MALRERLIATWGVLSVTALLGQAVARLLPYAVAPWAEGSMTTFQIALYVGWAVFNAYAEAYRGFQLRFSPRVVSRAFYLARNPTLFRLVFALPFCMSLFHAQRRQLYVSWGFVVGLTVVVALVRMLPQPWRGIVDGGVVLGLGWGIGVIWFYFLRAMGGGPEPEPTDLPDLVSAVPGPA